MSSGARIHLEKVIITFASFSERDLLNENDVNNEDNRGNESNSYPRCRCIINYDENHEYVSENHGICECVWTDNSNNQRKAFVSQAC